MLNAVNSSANESSNLTARRPVDIADTGLPEDLIQGLMLKILMSDGAMTEMEICDRIFLHGNIVRLVLDSLRARALVERRPRISTDAIEFLLTENGRNKAQAEYSASGYIGPAPVPLKEYAQLVALQSYTKQGVTQAQMSRAFDNFVIDTKVRDRLGASLNSGRPIFIYGPAGTGKTYTAHALARVLGGEILIPHSVLAGSAIIRLFDPVIHERVTANKQDNVTPLLIDDGTDTRYVRCKRPVVVTGGELTLEMLDLEYDHVTRQYNAPTQLKANNGLFLVDDLGRQRMQPDALLNRWIIPMEENCDYLALATGERFQVPFDVTLIFSTNLKPADVADEAFLRRMGYKVQFGPINEATFVRIWKDVCESHGLIFGDNDNWAKTIGDLYHSSGRDMLPCHPRDLVSKAVDYMRYEELPVEGEISEARLREAWESYFVDEA